MDRTMISWNVPNLVTINLMAWVGFLIFALVMQTAGKRGTRGAPSTSGSGDIVDPDYAPSY